MFMTRHWGSWTLGLDPHAVLVGLYWSRYEIRICPAPMVTLVKTRPDDWTRAARAGGMSVALDWVRRQPGYQPTAWRSWAVGGHLDHEPTGMIDGKTDDQPYEPGEPFLP